MIQHAANDIQQATTDTQHSALSTQHSRPVRVLMLSWEYTPHLVGGLGKHVVELLPELIDQGVEVHLVTPRFKGGEHEEPLRGVEHAASPDAGQVVELEEEPLRVPAGGPISNNSRVYRVD